MAQSKIEWTDVTWNPTTGCTKISAGCKHCYAELMSRRLQSMGVEKYESGFSLALHEAALEAPMSWQKPRTVFVNSMSDLFHRNVPDQFISQVFEVMVRCPKHRFQVLTKRAGRLERISRQLPWADNIWMGVSVEGSEQLSRIDSLRATGAAIKFLSLEPLIGPLPQLDLEGVNWVIVGGESGPRARPMEPAWVIDIRNRCREAEVPFFFKQWGGKNKKKTGRILEGKTYDEMPVNASTATA
jgi:protein gp37